MNKRALLLLTLVLIALGYASVSHFEKKSQQRTLERHALLTAQIWQLSGTLRNRPDSFAIKRDSLLGANNVSNDEMAALTTEFNKSPERLVRWTDLVRFYIDSLTRGQSDSL